MAAFTTRVELHDADWSDYEKLHVEMERRGFRRTITSEAKVVYALPPAEYNFEGVATRNDVLEKAKSAASTVKRSYEILVTESAGRCWHGLKPATKVAA